eukprot:CAMPEP_0197831678 /NCGR_PEP_ID=MMETSP1437-20131217/11514_1 /TAXON_ID=49252 ORGANISM="Eucampia antarctica, Strain CCMP1452" /NCGR_SAMPLE_ID=MMETSP1437 /ASSEMBLY_ACC=CAM_ASM_001096 /LENGTH=483 /DNA_ID=CAMNT_0043434699 /DNA_START=65 /DNA_END=1516 /DNA_ORIENTATION=-
MASKELEPLQNLLENILSRLSAVENKVGIEASDIPTKTTSSAAIVEEEENSSLVAYDKHVLDTVDKFADACDDLDGLTDIGSKIRLIWAEIRKVVTMGTKCKKPANVQVDLLPFLKPAQDAIAFIRQARLDRKYDWHIKAIMEMLVSISWVMVNPPPAPAAFVKNTIGSSDYWSNKIRKEYKGKDTKHIVFADTMKAMILDLSAYCKEYHLSGLMWNNTAQGIRVEDFVAPQPQSSKATDDKTNKTEANEPAMVDLVNELAKKKTSDGNSAATGLRKVGRDQQTWRKEYKQDATPAAVPVKASSTGNASKTTTTKPKGPPKCEYQNRGFKWLVENQTKESNPNGVCTVTIKDTKEQAYIYRCENATIILKGKIKGLVLDSCTNCSVVFDSAISSCEVVNCKKVQIQTLGICPSFAIDKTDGCMVYLSKESLSVSSFVTSKSIEMNVSWPDEATGDQKEAPIPEQFVHKFVGGSISSEVSDLYH